MARRRVFKRPNSLYPRRAWVSECYSCAWRQYSANQRRAFGRALRHTSCAGFGRG